ncbi:tetratricopeptide repeat protein, partial [Acinetobacter baumannii]
SRYDLARQRLQECLEIQVQLGNRRGVALARHSLALTARYRGDHREASEQLYESLQCFRDLEDLWGIVNSLEAYAMLAVARQQYDRAAR